MRTIQVDIPLDGEIVVDALGFKGKACEATKVIEQALGKAKSTIKKPEYNQDVQKTQTT